MKLGNLVRHQVPTFVYFYPKLTFPGELAQLEQSFKPVIVNSYKKLLDQKNALYFSCSMTDSASGSTCNSQRTKLQKIQAWQTMKRTFNGTTQIISDPIDNELFLLAMKGGGSSSVDEIRDEREEIQSANMKFLEDEVRLIAQEVEELSTIVNTIKTIQETKKFDVSHFAIKMDSSLGIKFQKHLVASSGRFTNNLTYQNLLKLAKDRYNIPSANESDMDDGSKEGNKVFTKWVENDAKIHSLHIFSCWLVLRRNISAKQDKNSDNAR